VYGRLADLAMVAEANVKHAQQTLNKARENVDTLATKLAEARAVEEHAFNTLVDAKRLNALAVADLLKAERDYLVLNPPRV
jgi:flagellar biosynthesis chaperone FliJ